MTNPRRIRSRRGITVGTVVRLALVPLAMVAMSAIVALPAHADPGANPVLGGTNTVGPPAPATASASLGNAVCAAVEQPGQSMTSVASALAAQQGTSPKMSELLTGLSVSVFCPTLMASLAGDDWLKLIGDRG